MVGQDFRIQHEMIADKYMFPISVENNKKFDNIFFSLTGEEG